MGSLTSAIAPIVQFGSSIASNIGSVAGFAQPFVNNAAQNRRDQAEINQLSRQINIKKAQNLLDYQATESARKSKLRAALASQRARFGGNGLDVDGGSSESVLNDLNAQSMIAGDENARSYALSNAALDEKLSNAQYLNLLDRQSRSQKTLLNALSDGF